MWVQAATVMRALYEAVVVPRWWPHHTGLAPVIVKPGATSQQRRGRRNHNPIPIRRISVAFWKWLPKHLQRPAN